MNRQIQFFAVLFSFAQCAFAWEPRSPRECRLAFLLGCSSFTGDLPSLSVFPHTGSASYSHFDRIARAYAEDIEISTEMLARGEWREKVAGALAKHYDRSSSHKTLEELFGDAVRQDIGLAAAYLAGAYSDHGTPTGFRLVNQRKGLYLAWLIRAVFVDITIDVTMRPGIPGNITITLRDGAQQSVQGCIEELEQVRSALSVRE